MLFSQKRTIRKTHWSQKAFEKFLSFKGDVNFILNDLDCQMALAFEQVLVEQK